MALHVFAELLPRVVEGEREPRFGVEARHVGNVGFDQHRAGVLQPLQHAFHEARRLGVARRPEVRARHAETCSFLPSRRRHTRWTGDWSSDVCSSDLSQLHRRRRYQQLFGPSSKRYPRYYRPNPASRRYVQHLRLWYAQSHPDEDFAETFAVWLRPRSNWRTRYAGWPALKKLEYVDELMDEIAGKRPLVSTRERVDPLSELSETLEEHYRKKQAFYAFKPPKTYDRDLFRLFSADPKHHRSQPASTFI